MEHFPKSYSTVRILHKFLRGSPSHGSMVLCPYIPSLYLTKVWRPIAFSGWVCALMKNELGPPCFLCENPANESIYVIDNKS